MEPYIAEIRMFGGNFAPRGWAFCDGQLLAVSQNDALFSILGTIYGGDGRTTFGLPDMRGRTPVHSGSGPGLSRYNPGQRGGAETVSLFAMELPSHTHTGILSPGDGNGGGSASGGYVDSTNDFDGNTGGGNMGGLTITDNTGSGQAHSNLQPFLVVHFIIALVGIYPVRN